MENMKDKDMYRVSIKSPEPNLGLLITIDGKTETADGFEFVAPFGHGLNIRSIIRLELNPEE